MGCPHLQHLTLKSSTLYYNGQWMILYERLFSRLKTLSFSGYLYFFNGPYMYCDAEEAEYYAVLNKQDLRHFKISTLMAQM